MPRKGERATPLQLAKARLTRHRTEYGKMSKSYEYELKRRSARIQELEQLVKELEND